MAFTELHDDDFEAYAGAAGTLQAESSDAWTRLNGTYEARVHDESADNVVKAGAVSQQVVYGIATDAYADQYATIYPIWTNSTITAASTSFFGPVVRGAANKGYCARYGCGGGTRYLRIVWIEGTTVTNVYSQWLAADGVPAVADITSMTFAVESNVFSIWFNDPTMSGAADFTYTDTTGPPQRYTSGVPGFHIVAVNQGTQTGNEGIDNVWITKFEGGSIGGTSVAPLAMVNFARMRNG